MRAVVAALLPRTLAPRARGRGLRCGGSSPLSGASHNTFLWHRRKTPARADGAARAYASPAADRHPRKPTAVPGRLRSRPAYPSPLAPRPPDPGGRARWSRSAPARALLPGRMTGRLTRRALRSKVPGLRPWPVRWKAGSAPARVAPGPPGGRALSRRLLRAPPADGFATLRLMRTLFPPPAGSRRGGRGKKGWNGKRTGGGAR